MSFLRSAAKALFDFAYKNEPKKSPVLIPRQYPNYGEKIKAFEAKLPKDIQGMVQVSNITPPNFSMYWNFYQQFPYIQNVINKIADRVTGLGGKWEDKEGNIQTNIDIEYSEFIRDICTHYLVYGQVLVLNAEIDGQQKWVLVPPHQIIYWTSTGFDISGFVWKWERTTVTVSDKKEFIFCKNSNVNSHFFGKSKLDSFYDELNLIFLDYENYSRFLSQSSFPGLFFKLKDGLTSDQVLNVLETIDQLATYEGKYQALGTMYVEEIVQIKQEIQNKLTQADKERVERLVYNAFSYPVEFIIPSGGLGRGEQKTMLLNLDWECITPLQKVVAKVINATQNSGNKDLVWVPNKMQLTTLDEMIDAGVKMFNAGLATAYEIKTKYLGYKDKDTNYDDKRYKLTNSDVIIKEGEMFKPITTDTTVPIENQTAQVVKAFPPINLQHAFEDKKDIQQILKGTNRNYSKTELLFDTRQFRIAKRNLNNAFNQQINNLDFAKIEKILQTKIKADPETNPLKDYISKNLTKLSDIIDVDALAKYLYFTTMFGRQDAYNNLSELGIDVNEEQKTKIGALLAVDIKTRTQSLLGYNNAKPKNELDPKLESSLDDTTVDIISTTLTNIWLNSDKDKFVSDAKRELFDKMDTRSHQIIQNETCRGINSGFIAATYFLDETHKLGYEWLRTYSKEPREEHLILVGRVAPINNIGNIFNGEYPGHKINCKCGLKLVKL